MKTRGFTKLMSVTGSEPVTLELLKQHLEIDFEQHDELLNVLLIGARSQVEKFLSMSLIDKTITARWEVLTSEELPYGPVKSIVSVKDSSGSDVSYSTEGLMGGFVSLVANRESPTVVTYNTGYDEEEFPFDIKLAIMKLATDNFEFRTGISLPGATKLPNNWKSTCRAYYRIPWTA